MRMGSGHEVSRRQTRARTGGAVEGRGRCVHTLLTASEVALNVKLLHRLAGAVNCILLHVLAHVRILDNCLRRVKRHEFAGVTPNFFEAERPPTPRPGIWPKRSSARCSHAHLAICHFTRVEICSSKSYRPVAVRTGYPELVSQLDWPTVVTRRSGD